MVAMKITEKFIKKRETKKEKKTRSLVEKNPGYKKRHEVFQEEDRYVLKWCGIILFLLIIGAALYQVKLYREKNVSISIGLNQERVYAQVYNLSGYERIPQATLTVDNKRNLAAMMVIAPSETNQSMMACQLDADHTQMFQTEGETGSRDNLVVCLQDRDTLKPATLRNNIAFFLGLDKRQISGGSSIIPTGILSLYFLRFTDTLHFCHDYLLMTYTITDAGGYCLCFDQAVLSFDALLKEARTENEAFSLEKTLGSMTYLNGLLNQANRFDSVYPALQTMTPDGHPYTLSNILVDTGNGFAINPQRRADLEKAVAAFADEAKKFADDFGQK